ncbi:uncharacterized protein LOC62_03G004759 [Vanrija pseudolonga]|uniref:Uncharacterized protein n=1 Tax=Vanrija pseudolonga TaxID=143232 RepID=A0AAF0Y709_9TREE|nr:hypothetical protein LOC62_03G004759 [Vanrija pseudolonga]
MSGHQNNQYSTQGQQPSLVMGMAIGNDPKAYEAYQWSQGKAAQLNSQSAQIAQAVGYGGPSSNTSQQTGGGSSGGSAPAYTYYPTNYQGK